MKIKEGVSFRQEAFVTDVDVLNNISDDIIYLREMLELEKIKGVNFLKAAHLGRITVVFVSNSIEAHRDYLVRNLGFAKKDMTWEEFFSSDLKDYFENILKEKKSSIQKVHEKIKGLASLRDFISHGLVDESARNFERKIGCLQRSNFFLNPARLTMSDIENILDFDAEMTELFGISACLYRSNRIE